MADLAKEHLQRFRAYLGERGLRVTNSILWDNEYELALYGGKWYVKVGIRRQLYDDRWNYYDVKNRDHETVDSLTIVPCQQDNGTEPSVVHSILVSLKGYLRWQLKDWFRLAGNIPHSILADRCEDEGLTAEAEVLRLPCSDTALKRWLKDRKTT